MPVDSAMSQTDFSHAPDAGVPVFFDPTGLRESPWRAGCIMLSRSLDESRPWLQVKEDVHRLQEKFKETYEGTQAPTRRNYDEPCRDRGHGGLQAHGDPWITPHGRAHRLGQAGARITESSTGVLRGRAQSGPPHFLNRQLERRLAIYMSRVEDLSGSDAFLTMVQLAAVIKCRRSAAVVSSRMCSAKDGKTMWMGRI